MWERQLVNEASLQGSASRVLSAFGVSFEFLLDSSVKNHQLETTVMFRNIPNSCSWGQLLESLSLLEPSISSAVWRDVPQC